MPKKIVPRIDVPHQFRIAQIPDVALRKAAVAAAAAAAGPPLGPLAAFSGTFAGKGFNLIFRPQSAATPTPLPSSVPDHNGKPGVGFGDNVLELNLTTETLDFSKPLGSIPNRGAVQGDIFLNGISYVQSISDVTGDTEIPIHFEPGLWLAVPATTNPAVAATVSRMASIPHGTTINLQGFATGPTAGPPVIPTVDPTPFFIANGQLQKFPSQVATASDTFRIPQDLGPFITAGTITQSILDDPNEILRDAIANQTIVETTTIHVASAAAGDPRVPVPGGGASNIAFLEGVGNQPNADVPVDAGGPAAGGNRPRIAGVQSTFWIEVVEHTLVLPVRLPGTRPFLLSGTAGAGLPKPRFRFVPTAAIPVRKPIKVRSVQIQYSQTVLLNFRGLTWPHVSVATLVPSAPIDVPSSAW